MWHIALDETGQTWLKWGQHEQTHTQGPSSTNVNCETLAKRTTQNKFKTSTDVQGKSFVMLPRILHFWALHIEKYYMEENVTLRAFLRDLFCFNECRIHRNGLFNKASLNTTSGIDQLLWTFYFNLVKNSLQNIFTKICKGLFPSQCGI